MTFKQAFAALTLIAVASIAVPSAPARADGAASTRNIILGTAAAATGAFLIINHNRKVHQRYAEDAHKQAVLEQENNNAWAAYRQEQRAYEQETAANRELQKEIAYQHRIVDQQRRQLSSLHVNSSFAPAAGGGGTRVALESYGWGDL